MKFVLYHTAGCHLCEEAQQILTSQGVSIKLIDIAGDVSLEARYERRIPVLACEEGGAELGWPFDAPEVKRFLSYCADSPTPA